PALSWTGRGRCGQSCFQTGWHNRFGGTGGDQGCGDGGGALGTRGNVGPRQKNGAGHSGNGGGSCDGGDGGEGHCQHTFAGEGEDENVEEEVQKAKVGAKKARRTRGTGETLIGALDLLREAATRLEHARRLVEAGVGWWEEESPRERITPKTWGMVVADGGDGEKPLRRGGRGGTSSLRERTKMLLCALHDDLVSEGLLGQGRGCNMGKGWTGVYAACAPPTQAWLLGLFFEVLAPYLSVVGGWVSEGRLEDPHGEVFFSPADVRDGTVPGGGRRGEVMSTAAPAVGWEGERGGGAPDNTPVLFVRNTGLVIHLAALPGFLAPLALPVAFAGQDILLMRKIRSLAASATAGTARSVECGT
ncbi:unnamed protein product, partial [Discosporangium mesarthrocarpum]